MTTVYDGLWPAPAAAGTARDRSRSARVRIECAPGGVLGTLEQVSERERVTPPLGGLSMATTSKDATQHVATTDAARLMRPDEVAAFLGIPLRTIYRWRTRREGPSSYRIGRHIRYRVDDVERWLEERRVEH
jgi:excisionase family DNA binding protein